MKILIQKYFADQKEKLNVVATHLIRVIKMLTSFIFAMAYFVYLP